MDKNVLILISGAASGDQDAFAELREMYKGLIDACVRRYTTADMTEQDVEDLSQEALIRFFSAVCSFDTKFENVEFGLYAKICIENGLVSFLRSHNRQNRVRTVEFDGVDADCDQSDTDILQLLVDRERTNALVIKITKQLSEYENRVWWMYVSGMSVSEISKRLSVTTRSISNAIYRIRQKLKRSMTAY